MYSVYIVLDDFYILIWFCHQEIPISLPNNPLVHMLGIQCEEFACVHPAVLILIFNSQPEQHSIIVASPGRLPHEFTNLLYT